ncbi:hypothetical protein [Paenibacillus stellifer]
MGGYCGGEEVGGAHMGPAYCPGTSTGAILVLFILLVIITKSFWI